MAPAERDTTDVPPPAAAAPTAAVVVAAAASPRIQGQTPRMSHVFAKNEKKHKTQRARTRIYGIYVIFVRAVAR